MANVLDALTLKDTKTGKTTEYEIQDKGARAQIAAQVAASTDENADYAAEVVDARVGAEGESYASLGEAIRGQRDKSKEEISELKSDLTEVADKGVFRLDIMGEMELVKGYRDGSGMHMGSLNTIAFKDVQIAQKDMVISTDDFDTYRFALFLYDKDGVTLLDNSWYGSKTFPLLKGSRYAVQMRYADTRNISDVNDVIRKHIHCYEIHSYNRKYYTYIAYDKDVVSIDSNPNTGNIIRQYAEEDMLVGLKDYSNAKYSLFVWKSEDEYVMSEHYHNLTEDSIVEKGKWYIVTTNGNTDNIKEVSKRYDEVMSAVNYSEENKKAINSLNLDVALLRNRVIKLENSNPIPTYYEQHIANKCDIINELKPQNGVQFAFITDPHINAYTPTLHSKALLTYIAENTFIDSVVCGGDVVNGFYDNRPTPAQFKTMLMNAVDYCRADYPIDSVFVMGNHDSGVDYNSSGEESEPLLTDKGMARYTMPNLHNKSNLMHDPNCELNFCYDDDLNKIHYIITTANLKAYHAVSETYTDNYRWFCEALVACPSGYTTIVFNHVIFSSVSSISVADFTEQLLNVCDAYNSRGKSAMYAGDKTTIFDFANCGGKVACWIGGHTHKDMTASSTNGIPVIVTTTDNCGGEGGTISRNEGTYTEQAFDVFSIDTDKKTIKVTRIGGGSDRSFTY